MPEERFLNGRRTNLLETSVSTAKRGRRAAMQTGSKVPIRYDVARQQWSGVQASETNRRGANFGGGQGTNAGCRPVIMFRRRFSKPGDSLTPGFLFLKMPHFLRGAFICRSNDAVPSARFNKGGPAGVVFPIPDSPKNQSYVVPAYLCASIRLEHADSCSYPTPIDFRRSGIIHFSGMQ